MAKKKSAAANPFKSTIVRVDVWAGTVRQPYVVESVLRPGRRLTKRKIPVPKGHSATEFVMGLLASLDPADVLSVTDTYEKSGNIIIYYRKPVWQRVEKPKVSKRSVKRK